MLIKSGETKFGLGRINEDPIIAYLPEVEYGNNALEGTLSLQTYVDSTTGVCYYKYKDTLCTISELRLVYLKDYYEVTDEEMFE